MNVVNPVITVLMPVYNGQKYLSETIESILSQSYKNFEFLIVDTAIAKSAVPVATSRIFFGLFVKQLIAFLLQ